MHAHRQEALLLKTLREINKANLIQMQGLGACLHFPTHELFFIVGNLFLFAWMLSLFALLLDSFIPQGCAAGLTEGVVQLFDSEGEAAVRAVNAEEDHGDVLRRAADGSRCCGGAVVCVALVERERVVLPARELLSFENPAVKHLQEEYTWCGEHINYARFLLKKNINQNHLMDFKGFLSIEGQC